MGGTKVRQSIFKTSTLPTTYKQVKYNPEIVGKVEELQAEFREGATVRLSGVQREINGGTTVRQSIVRTSTLPTINQGVTYLGTVFGGTTRTVKKDINLGTTINNAQYNVTSGSIMGVGGGVGDLAADVTYSTKPDNNQVYNTGIMQTTTTTTGSTFGTGNIMGVGGGIGDLASDVTYSTKPDNNQIYGTGMMTTTQQSAIGTPIVGSTTVASPILGTTTVSSPIIGTSVGTPVLGSTVGTGNIMGVGGGVGDLASDVTYSTKPDNKQAVYPGVTI